MLFSSSAQRWEILKKHVELSIKSQSDTRWESRIKCIKPLRYNLKEVLLALKDLEAISIERKDGRASPVALQLRPAPKVSARAPAHRSYHFRGVKLKSCIKKIHHNLYISKQANVRIKHADTEGASHKKFGTDARVQ